MNEAPKPNRACNKFIFCKEEKYNVAYHFSCKGGIEIR